ncbi:MAG: DUF4129 domain-containing protein, partial [Chloroflexi bacterium]|nr:DUF4129 domain-containing protein [Chloroflexota bacterium]
IALLLVARGLARWRPSSADADATNEERESLLGAREAWARLLGWLRRLLGRDAVVPIPAQSTAPAEVQPPRPRTGVRELYAQLLQRGEWAGAQRAVATTPLEHETALRRTLEPDHVVTELTTAYVRVRYGDEQVDDGDVAELAEELERVQPIPAVE